MARQFFALYLLIAVTLVAASWGQDKLLQAYAPQTADDKPLLLTMAVLKERLLDVPPQGWRDLIAAIGADAHVDVDLLPIRDVVGRETLDRLEQGQIAHMQGSDNESWTLRQLNSDYVLALRSKDPDSKRTPLEWMLTVGFYALIAFAVMIWIWPLTRDLKMLEKAVARFGDRNWAFDAKLASHSQVYSLSETFRRMAARIDALITSHKDMSNAVSHEIKTPLARMQFEIELASRATDLDAARRSMNNIKADIGEIDDLVTATLDYAILERADLSLSLGVHDFAAIIPAMVESARRDARSPVRMTCNVRGHAGRVVCDLRLMESAVKNLLQNAVRFAKADVRVTFDAGDYVNQLMVDDDGPGIPEADRERVFASFVQLEPSNRKTGFGLGLAIVKRTVEWHKGRVSVAASPLGGARLIMYWPAA